MNEKSREELSGLLLKADGIIKSRETGALRVSCANLVVAEPNVNGVVL